MTDYERSLGIRTQAGLRLRRWSASDAVPVEMIRDVEQEAGVLDSAWAAAEAAMPEGGHISSVGLDHGESAERFAVTHYATAHWAEGALWQGQPDDVAPTEEFDEMTAHGPTPVAALWALAARLKEGTT